MGKIENDLFGAVETIARQVVEKNGADITVRGEVIRTANVEVGEYKVRYEGNTWSAFAQSPTIVYDQGDEVYVLIPEANFNNKKIILGHAAYENNSTNSDLTEMTNKYVPMGPNWLSNNWYSGSLRDLNITAAQDLNGEDDERSELIPGEVDENPAKEEHGWFSNFGFVRTKEQLQKLQKDERNPYVTYGKESGVKKMEPEEIKTVDKLLQGYSATADYLMIKADFRTDFNEVHRVGEYYLAVQVIEASAEVTSLNLRIEELNKSIEFATAEQRVSLQKQKTELQDKLKKMEQEKPYEITEYRLGFNSFNSQLYGLPVDTPQTAYLPITPGSVKGLYSVYLGQDGNMSMDREIIISQKEGIEKYSENVNDRPNIFASNIEIQFMHKVNLLDGLYYSFIETPKGDSVYNKKDAKQLSVDLKARLFYGYQDVLTEDNCEVYWFREDPRMINSNFANQQEEELFKPSEKPKPEKWILEEPKRENYIDEEAFNEDYKFYEQFLAYKAFKYWEPFKDDMNRSLFDYSGPGWIPVNWINQRTMKNKGWESEKDDELGLLYKINFDNLTVPYRQVPMRWNYKAVIVYKGERRTTTDPEVTVYRSDSLLDFTLKEIIDDATHKMYLQVYDLKYPQDKFVKKDETAESEASNSENYEYEYYPEEIAQWFIKDNATVYKEITTDHEYTEDVKRPEEAKGFIRDDTGQGFPVLEGPKLIAHYLISPIVNLIAAIYIGEGSQYPAIAEQLKQDGWELTDPVAALSHEVISLENIDLLVEWEGQDTFVYNSDGSLMNKQDKANHTLSYKLKWVNGTQQNFIVDVLGPERKVLTNNAEVSSEKSMMSHFHLSPDNTINFLVLHDFDKYRTQNYFIVRITSAMTGQVWETRKDIVFIKNGEQGSNGTSWFAPIYPCHFKEGNAHQLAFSSPVLSEEMPIRLKAPRKADGSIDWEKATQVEDEIYAVNNDGIAHFGKYNHLVLRPFVTKNGIPIQEIRETTNDDPNRPAKVDEIKYTYNVFWDVRFPENDLIEEDLKGNSCLRLKTIEFDANSGAINFEQGKLGTGTYDTDLKDDGLVLSIESKDTVNKPYGAVEVIYRDSSKGSDKVPWINPVNAHYNFYVKATIDVYENRKPYGETGDTQITKVATLTSYYPVDILICPETFNVVEEPINSKNLSLNWPKDIKYNVTGYQPQAWTDKLQFNYQLTNKDNYILRTNAPENRTSRLIEINESKLTKTDAYGNIVYTGETEYTLKPRTYCIWMDNYHAAMSQSFEIAGRDTVLQLANIYLQVHQFMYNFSLNKDLSLYETDINYKTWYDILYKEYEDTLAEEAIIIYDEFGNLKYADTVPSIVSKTVENPVTGEEVTIYGIKRTKYNPPSDKYEYFRTIITVLDIYGGNMSINGWDGTRIDIREDKGTIFAPTIGAGYKHPYKNTFTGVLMGIDTSQVKPGENANYAKFPEEELDKNKYMVGLYGYQDGVSSFGIMENGTAFFGRADRGGKIIIDGYNAQIYGGMRDKDSNSLGGDRDMDMTNRMRLSFIDFDNIALNEYIDSKLELEEDQHPNQMFYEGQWYEINPNKRYIYKRLRDEEGNYYYGYEQDKDGDLLQINENKYVPIVESHTQINIDNIDILPGAFDVRSFREYFATTNTDIKAQVAGFGSGRGYSTPAIEIGSYKNYMELNPNNKGSDLIRELTIDDIKAAYGSIKDLEIPGYRKFLVTYDGTLYAMNAFIKGNLVSSNIIGSQFFNADGTFAVTEHGNLGIGKGKNVKEEIVKSGYSKTWSYNIPTTRTVDAIKYLESDDSDDFEAIDYEQGKYAFYVSSSGKVICNEIHIAGGSLNIGNFHIIGNDGYYSDEGVWTPVENLNSGGDVVSFGTMYLVGAKDNSSGKGEATDGTIAVQGWGDFYLRGKMINLGEVLLGGTVDKAVPGTGNTTKEKTSWDKYVPTFKNSPFSLKPTKRDNQYDFIEYPLAPIRGAFWPISFYIGSAFNAAWKGTEDTYTSDLAGQAWFGLPIGNKTGDSYDLYTNESDYDIPVFAYRDRAFTKAFGFDSNYPIRTMFRVDSNGLWTDLIFFRQVQDEETATLNTTKLTDPKIALGFITGQTIDEHEQLQTTYGFGIKNITSPNKVNAYSQMIFEAEGDMRMTTMQKSLYLESKMEDVVIKAQNIRFNITATDKPWDHQFGIYARFG